jgi:hypothetical protein
MSATVTSAPYDGHESTVPLSVAFRQPPAEANVAPG